jgi:flavin-binding protein dodecin
VPIAPITKATPKTAAEGVGFNPVLQEGMSMSIVRSIEVIAQSPNSFDEACREAIREASRTLRGIRSFWIKNAECVVENDQITMYRVNGKISFLVEESK